MDPAAKTDNPNVADIFKPPAPRPPRAPLKSSSPLTSMGPMTLVPGATAPPPQTGAPQPAGVLPPNKMANFFASSCDLSQEASIWESERRADVQAEFAASDQGLKGKQEKARKVAAAIEVLNSCLGDSVPEDSIQSWKQALGTEPNWRELNHLIRSSSAGNGLFEDTEQGEKFRGGMCDLLATSFMDFLTPPAVEPLEGFVLNDDFLVRYGERLEECNLVVLMCAALSSNVTPRNSREEIRKTLTQISRKFPPLRPTIGTKTVQALKAFAWSQSCIDPPLSDLLFLILPIISGLKTPLGAQHEYLIHDVLAPLHVADYMVDELTVALSLYYKPLGLCVRTALRKLSPERHFELGSAFLRRVMQAWNSKNSKHTTILLNSLQEIIEEIDGEVFDDCADELFVILGHSFQTEHSAVAQRALQYFQSEAFITLIDRNIEKAIGALSGPLVRDGNLQWNESVNSKLGAAIDILSKKDDAAFKLAAAQHLQKAHKMDPMGTVVSYIEQIREKREKSLAVEKAQNEEKRRRMADQRSMKLSAAQSSLTRFVFIKDLGVGSYSVVRHAKLVDQQAPASVWVDFAIKVMEKDHLARQNFTEQVQREISTLKSMDHPGVTKLYTSFETEQKIFLVLDFCENGDLFSTVIEQGSSVTPKWLKFFLAEVGLAIQHVHEAGFYYGDLKPENVLVKENYHLCLCDFGSVKNAAQMAEINQEMSKHREGGGGVLPNSILHQFPGTLDYMPPEILSGSSDAGPWSDWWALGCCAFQLLCGRLPYVTQGVEEKDEQSALTELILQGELSFPAAFDDCPLIKEVITGLLHPDPSQRWGLQQLRESQLFKEEGSPCLEGEGLFNQEAPTINLRRSVEVEQNPQWKRRKFSMMQNPLPQCCPMDANQVADPIPEINGPALKWDFYKEESPRTEN